MYMKQIVFIILLIVSFNACTIGYPYSELDNTVWISDYFEIPEDGISEPFDELIVFHTDGNYTLYCAANNYMPIMGTYTIDGKDIVFKEDNNIKTGIYSINNDTLTIDYLSMSEDVHFIDRFVNINQILVPKILNSKFKEYNDSTREYFKNIK